MDPKFLDSPETTNTELNRLFSASWPAHRYTDFSYLAERSLGYVCCYVADELIGFVNLAWDGNKHAFILDTTVTPAHRGRGIGKLLVDRAVELAGAAQVEWVHVDFEPQYEHFYRTCGFMPTGAGLIRIV